MELILKALVFAIQLNLAGFVLWGGWLCFREWFLGKRSAPAERGAPASSAPSVEVALPTAPRHADFERAASLVLLALLCTTIAAL